jgi:hypothetical protein
MALVSTQPLIEMSTRNLPGCNGRLARKVDNLTAIYEPIVQIMWEPPRETFNGHSRQFVRLFFLSLYTLLVPSLVLFVI